MHAEKCPICGGLGYSGEGDCHGCQGKGWVPVPDEMPVGNWPWSAEEVNKPSSGTYIPGLIN